MLTTWAQGCGLEPGRPSRGASGMRDIWRCNSSVRFNVTGCQ